MFICKTFDYEISEEDAVITHKHEFIKDAIDDFKRMANRCINQLARENIEVSVNFDGPVKTFDGFYAGVDICDTECVIMFVSIMEEQ